MKIDIPYYIRQVLREQRMVTIPGIGTFRLQQISAIFNDDKSILSPPLLNLTFDDAESSDDSALLRYISDTGLIPESKAKKKIEQYTQAAFNKLLNVNSFVIEGIGKVTRNEGEDIVHFEPHVHKLTKEFSDFKPIPLSPISRINEGNAVAAGIGASSQVKETGSFLPRIILLSLLLITLYFLGRYFYNSYFLDSNNETMGLIDEEREKDSTLFNEAETNDLEQKYEEIDELIDPESIISKDEQSNNDKLNEELGNLEGSTNNSALEVDHDEMGGSALDEKNKNNNESENIGGTGSGEKGDSTKAALIDKSENKHAAIIPESGECIIVVGSFIKSLNTIKMISLLERKGYKVHQEEYKGFNRVGIKYECANEDLELYLQNIRKKISSKAWYLDPELEVPYLK